MVCLLFSSCLTCAIQASLYPVACLTGILSNAIQLPLSQWYYVSSVVPFLPTCSSCVLHIAVFGHGLNFSKIRQTLITTQVSFRRKRHCFVTGHCCLISSTLLVPPTYIPGENVVALMAYLCPIGIEGTLFTDQQRPHEPSTSVLDWLDCWEVKIGQAGGVFICRADALRHCPPVGEGFTWLDMSPWFQKSWGCKHTHTRI